MSTALVSRSERPPAPAGAGARKLTERAFRIRESAVSYTHLTLPTTPYV